MSASASTDQAWRRSRRNVSSVPDGALDNQRVEEAGHAAKGHPLFVIPDTREDGFRASVRGHMLELADPDSGHGLAPTPDDLHTAAIASHVAWFARRFLRDRGVDDYVSVTAWRWKSDGSPMVGGVDAAVTISKDSVPVRAMLSNALERECADNFGGRVRLQVGTE